MKPMHRKFVIALMTLGLLTSVPVLAQMGGHGTPEKEKKEPGMSMGMGGMGSMGKGGMSGHGRSGGYGMGHFLGASWRHTLTDDQKVKVNALHLKLKKDLSILEAEKHLKKAELGLLVVEESPDRKAIEQKVGEIANLKRRILMIKTMHQVEMRAVLSPEQRVSFDTMVLGHGGR